MQLGCLELEPCGIAHLELLYVRGILLVGLVLHAQASELGQNLPLSSGPAPGAGNPGRVC